MKLESLTHEMQMLRSLVVSLVRRDSEGQYRPEFVRKILHASKLQPTRRFTNAKGFLVELSNAVVSLEK